MSYRIVIGMVAALVITGAAACTKSEAPKPAAAPAASAPKEAPAAAPAAKPADKKADKKTEKKADKKAMGGDAAKPGAPKPEPDADDT